MDAPPRDIVDTTQVIEVSSDRCDAKDCGAKAYVFAQLAPGPLAFCAHHGTEYMPALVTRASVIIDFRDQVLA